MMLQVIPLRWLAGVGLNLGRSGSNWVAKCLAYESVALAILKSGHAKASIGIV